MSKGTPAADRLLRTAGELFCREGIRSVGIDRIVEEAGVAKATLYQAFGSKQALALAWLSARHEEDQQAYRSHAAHIPAGGERVLASFDIAEAAAASADYVGCVYANALNEFPDPAEPIATAVREHREWLKAQWMHELSPRRDAQALVEKIQISYDGALLGAKVERNADPIRLARDLVSGWIHSPDLG